MPAGESAECAPDPRRAKNLWKPSALTQDGQIYAVVVP
jgi:hypothetical protein